MKLRFLLPLLIAFSAFADSALVVFTPRSATYGALTNVLITIRPLSFPGSDGIGEVTINSITNRTGTSTNFATNLYTPGSYEISYLCTNPLYRTVFTNTFPTNTTGTVYSRDYISTSINSGNLVGFSQNSALTLFAKRTNAIQRLQTNGVDIDASWGGITNINLIGATGMVSGATAIIGGFSGGASGQPASAVLTNLSNTASNNVDYVTALAALTNVANTASNRTWTADDNATNIINTASNRAWTADSIFTNVINTASNRTWAADNWSTNRHAAALTNNHSVTASVNTNLAVGGHLYVTNSASTTTLTNSGAAEFQGPIRFTDSSVVADRVAVYGATRLLASANIDRFYLDFLTNTFLTNFVRSSLVGSATNFTVAGTWTVNSEATNKNGLFVGGAGNSLVRLMDTNTGLSVAFQAAHGTVRSNLNLFVPTNGMGGNHAGILIATNAGGGTNAQTTIAAIGSGLSLSSDGKTLSASGGSSAFNTTNLYVSNSAVVVADLANFDRLKVYAISNGTIHLSNASSFLKRGRALIQQSTNGLAAITWSVPGGLLQTNVNIGNNTNANALDVLEFEQSFFDTNLFAWWPSNFLPRVAFTNSLASGGGFTPSDIAGLYVWMRDDALGLGADATVASWTDTVSSVDGAQSTENKKPLYRTTGGPDSTTAIEFDGSNDAMQTDINLDLSAAPKNALSVWFYWNAYANDDDLLMELGPNAGSSGGFYIDPNSSGGTFDFVVFTGVGLNVGTIPRPPAAEWVHLVVNFDIDSSGTEVTSVYTNGVAATITPGLAFNNTANFNADKLNLMARNDGASLHGQGKLHNLIVYTNINLTAGNVTSLYNFK